MRGLIVAIVVVIAVVLGPAAARAQSAESPPMAPTIVTTGESTVSRAPDVAYMTLAVETRAKNPRDAQKLNADAMGGVQKQLADAGIQKSAQRTLVLSLDRH